MARKKRKADARAKQRGEDALDMLRAADFSGAPGRWFWGLLAAGLALRVLAALSGNNIVRTDETFQYLEQAHRLVFGYGVVPWEFGVGARSWLTVAPAALALGAAKLLGLDHPDQYIAAVRVFHAALSMGVPVGMFFFARRYYGRRTAFAALALGCFWHETVIFAPHALSEFYSVYLMFGALALASASPSRARMLTAGILLGFALTMRFHYGMVVFGIAAAWVFALSRRSAEEARRTALWGTAGGLAVFAVFLVVDWTTWGVSHSSVLTYFQAMTDGRVPQLLNNDSPYTHIANLAGAGGGICFFALALAFLRWRRHGLILALALPTAAFNIAQDVQSYSVMFALVCLLLLVAADWTADALFSPIRRPAGLAAVCVALLIAVAGFSGNLSEWKRAGGGQWVASPVGAFLKDKKLEATRFISRLPPEEVGAVIVDALLDDTGAYYYLHHRVPIYPAAHLQGHDWRKVATHIVTARDLGGRELEKIYDEGGMKIYKTGAAPSPPLPEYSLDAYNDDVIRSLLRAGVIDSPPEKIPF